MTKNTKRLLIMLCAVLLMGGLLALLSLPDSDDQLVTDDDTDHTAVSDENELLIDRSTLDLTKLVMVNSNGTFTAEADDNGDLYIAELAGIPLNTDFIEVAWYCAVSIGYSNEISLPDDGSVTLADYGLEPPQAYFTTTYADGTGNTLYIGNEVTADSDSYYFQIDNDPSIYVTTLDFSYFQGEKYWISDDMFGTAYEGDVDITRISIELPQDGDKMVIVPNTAADKSDPCYGYDYILTTPETCAADDYFMSTLIDELSWLTAYEAVEAYPTADELAAYGLDSPYARLEIVRNGTSYRLDLARYDYDTLYATVDDIPVIWQIDAASNEALASLSMRTVRSADVHIRYFDAIESMTVIFDGNEYVFRTERIAMNDTSELYEYYSYYGDTSLSLSNFKAMLEIFNHAAASEYTDGNASGEPYLTIIIDYFDTYDRDTETITYTENGTRRYLCQINGIGTANVTTMWISKFITSIQTLAAGETVIP